MNRQELKLAARVIENLPMMSPDVMQGWINDPKGLQKFLSGLVPAVEEAIKSILTLLRTVKMLAHDALITSKEYFEGAGVKSMGGNFQTQFLGLELSAVGETELAVHKLEENSLDAPIMAERGDKTETSVSQFRTFLHSNRNSSEYFIFYLRGKDGNLWAVYAHWYSDLGGWHVRANSVADPYRWDAGDQVVCRN